MRNSEDYGFFDGKEKDTDKSVIFASIATLGRPEYLNEAYFPADYFDYVIIDEFHHAVTDQYRRIVEYFQPQFLLGLTATPERMDGKNIYEICDYNVPYQISLKEAINKGMLVPFHYYGVYDETDYSGLRIVKGRYDEQELNQAYIENIVLCVQSDSAVPDSMQKTWQKNSVREESHPQQYTAVKMEHMLRSVTKLSAN